MNSMKDWEDLLHQPGTSKLFPLVGHAQRAPRWLGFCWDIPEIQASRYAPLGLNILARMMRVGWIFLRRPTLHWVDGAFEASYWMCRAHRAEDELRRASAHLDPIAAVEGSRLVVLGDDGWESWESAE